MRLSCSAIIKKLLPKSIKDKIKGRVHYLKDKGRALNLKDSEALRVNGWQFGNIKRVAITDIFSGIEDVEVKIVNCFKREIGTSVDLIELLYLVAIAKITKARKICEIGTFDGNTILNLAVNAPQDASLVTIDLPPDWKGKHALVISSSSYNVTDRDKIGYQFKNTEFAKRINQIFCDSATLDWDTINGPFDLVFIDGCHDHEYVKIDTENAFRHLSNKGVIVWHDYGMISDVSDVVDGLGETMEIKVIAGTRLAVGFKK